MTSDPDKTVPYPRRPSDDGEVTTRLSVPNARGEEVVAGRYTIERPLGQGGMAEVFLARQDGPHGFRKRVVLKRIRRMHVGQQKYVDMFLREARLSARLNHPHIVQTYELLQDEAEFVIVMEHIDGLPWNTVARRVWSRGESLPMEVVLRAGADAALGLHYAHALKDESGAATPLVHRDISPDNLMLSLDGMTKVLDLGIAKVFGDDLSQPGEIKGKVPFMAPEQVQQGALDGRTDLYALGITLYWLLTGTRPFGGTNVLETMKKIIEDAPRDPAEINPLLPPQVSALVLALLEKRPADRPASGRAVHDAINRLLDGTTHVDAADFLTPLLAMKDDVPATAPTLAIPAARPKRPAAPSSSAPPVPVVRSSLRPAIAAGVVGAFVLAGLLAYTLAPSTPEPAALLPERAPLPVAPLPVAPTPEPVAPTPEPVAPAVVEARPKAAPGKRRAVALDGPASVRWQTLEGAPLGRGRVQADVPEGAKAVTALDGATGNRARVPIVDGAARYGALGTGRLLLFVNPWADVTIGPKKIGTLPFGPVDLVAGQYDVKLTYEGRTTVVRVEVVAGKDVTVTRTMAPSP